MNIISFCHDIRLLQILKYYLIILIFSAGGAIMGLATKNYADIAAFQPVVNGVGGNLVAIFASRLSTALHRTSTQGSKPSWSPLK